jgi:membrane protease YdiL (CAAX protease family)
MTDELELSPRVLFRVGFFFELGLVLVAALLGKLIHEEPFPFRLEWSLEALLWSAIAAAPPIAGALFLTSPLGRRLLPFRRIYERVRDVLGKPLRGLSLDEIVLLAGAAGIGEEVLFRGVLQPAMGLWLTSLVFGLLHALTPTYFLLATLMGLYLGWLQLETDNLVVPIGVHWAYDVIALYILKHRFETDDARDREAERAKEPQGGAGEDAAGETLEPPGQ